MNDGTRSDPQLELPLGGNATDSPGLDRWHAERETALRNLARELGLPLGHRTEVFLRDGTRLIGNLRLAEDRLWIDPRRDLKLLLRIDACTFAAAEIESCVRLD